MRIGIVCPNFPPATFEGGISHYSQILAKQLLKRNHKVFGIGSSEFATDLDQSAIQPEINCID